MKVIHIAGWSGAGKTTFIINLCCFLSKIGRTATIKHIGEHICLLPSGKDTTLQFESGAETSIGIDIEKTIIMRHDIELDHALDLLCNTGIQYAVIEGFKRRSFKKVAIGDFNGDVLLKNPEPRDVIACLDLFDDWYTPSAIINELSVHNPEMFILSRTWYSGSPEIFDKSKRLESEFSKKTGVLRIKIRVLKPAEVRPYQVFIALVSEDPKGSAEIINEVVKRLEDFNGKDKGE